MWRLGIICPAEYILILSFFLSSILVLWLFSGQMRPSAFIFSRCKVTDKYEPRLTFFHQITYNFATMAVLRVLQVHPEPSRKDMRINKLTKSRAICPFFGLIDSLLGAFLPLTFDFLLPSDHIFVPPNGNFCYP